MTKRKSRQSNRICSDQRLMNNRRLTIECLEHRQLMTASMGWDGPGRGTAELKYYIGNAPASISQSDFEKAIESALAAWSQAADIEFVRTFQAGQNDSLDFTSRNIDGPGQTLAQAYFPDDVNPSRIAGDVVFDSSESWEVGNLKGNAAFDLLYVAVHEIGHSLGLEHTDDPGSVLLPYLMPNQQFTGLDESDVEAIQRLYAPANANVASNESPKTPTSNNSVSTNPVTPPPTESSNQTNTRPNNTNRPTVAPSMRDFNWFSLGWTTTRVEPMPLARDSGNEVELVRLPVNRSFVSLQWTWQTGNASQHRFIIHVQANIPSNALRQDTSELQPSPWSPAGFGIQRQNIPRLAIRFAAIDRALAQLFPTT